MRRYLGTLTLFVLITGAALWGAEHLQFLQRLPIAFSQTVFAASGELGEGMQRRGQGRFRGGAGLDSHEGFMQGGGGFGGRGLGRRQHAQTPSLEGWINVLAYLSIFSFVVMLTYYSEKGLRKVVNRQEPCSLR